QTTVTVPSNKMTLDGETGYLFKVSIRPVGGDWTTNLATANQVNINVAGVTPPTAYTPLMFKSSAKCIDVTAGSTANGVKLQQYTCFANNTNQSFLFENRGDGYWGIKNSTSGKCIDKTGSVADGALVHQWTCSTTNDNQAFKLIDKGAGYFQLQNKHSGKCLDIVGGAAGTVNSTQITQTTCGNSESQQLKF
ncbi:MAG: RICIN domain-containing protein, partial [Thalassotalea sp.]